VEVLARHARSVPFRTDLHRRVARAGARRNPEPTPGRLHALKDRLSPATLDWVVEDYRRGTPSTEIARSLGVAKAGILSILHDRGVELRLRPMTDKERDEAVRLYQQGWSLARVGKQLGRDPTSIRNVLERENIPRRDPQGRSR
jgi:hypothetical protein